LDGYAKPSASKQKRSLRTRSGRKPGGQDGHEGAHPERAEVPDERIEYEPECCDGCGGDLGGAERVEGGEESRQVAGWRTDQGASSYLRVRSYISTARKQGHRPLDVLSELAAGHSWLPLAAGP
jgi:hypothetical protein